MDAISAFFGGDKGGFVDSGHGLTNGEVEGAHRWLAELADVAQ